MNKQDNIYLTGFMGTGKSTVGRALARRLNRPFVDVDKLIENKTGLTVAELFARRGEPAFRKIERMMVLHAARTGGKVVSLGGGTLLDTRNQKTITGSGRLVALTCAEPELWRRLRRVVAVRPLLAGKAPRRRLRALLKKRRALYDSADVSLSTRWRGPESVARLIVARLQKL